MVDTSDLVSRCAPYPNEFKTLRALVRSAVNIGFAYFRMPNEVDFIVPLINRHRPKAAGTLNQLLNEDNSQRIVEMKSNPDTMRLFTCIIDFDVSTNRMIDALRPRQPYGQEEWRDSGPMPQSEPEAPVHVNAAASSSASTPSPATAAGASAPAPRESLILRVPMQSRNQESKRVVATTPKVACDSFIRPTPTLPIFCSASWTSVSASTSDRTLSWTPISLTPVMLGTPLQLPTVLTSPKRQLRADRASPARSTTPEPGWQCFGDQWGFVNSPNARTAA